MGVNQATESGRSPKPLPKKDARLDRVGCIGADGDRAGMTNAPGKASRNQHFVTIVAVGFVFEADVGLVEARRMTRRPVLIDPCAVDGERQSRREQPGESRIDTALGDVASLRWVIEIAKVGQNEFVGDRGIVEGHCAGKIAIAGEALDTHLKASLAIDALNMAIEARRPAPGSLIHHSDRGVQYACGDYAAALEAHDIQPSMSRVGNPYDNAKAESFMKTLKQEGVDGRRYRDTHHARGDIGAFIEKSIIASGCTRPWPINRPPSSVQHQTATVSVAARQHGFLRHAEIYGDAV
jgi:hypothetical protein